MKKKIVMFAVLLSLLVSIAVPGSDSITAMADEVYEWTNFAEYCYYNDIDMDKLPVEYDETKSYMLAQWGRNGTKYILYLFVWDSSVTPRLYQTKSSYTYAKFVPNTFVAVYKLQYSSEWYDGTGWSGISTDTSSVYTISDAIGEPMYSDASFYNGDKIVYPITKTGQYVQWGDAVAKLTDEQKTKLQSYENYIVHTIPIRLNDWKSEQHVIMCSNSNKAIIRDEAYNALCFTTGSGKEPGYTLIFDSFSQAWQVYSADYASSLGSVLASGGGEPVVLYTSVDVYYEDGTSYAQDTEVWCTAVPYGSVTPTPEPTPTPVVPSGGFNIVTYSSQIKAEVKVDSVNMRDKPSLESNVVASFIKTWDVDVLGYVYADDGAIWYYCKTMRDDMEYIGFIKAEYLTVLSVENNDFNIDFGDIDLEDMPELITTAKNSFIELLGFVGVVPMMIAVVFGFLPSWCLGVVGVTVVVLCLLAIIKRG